MFWLIIVYNGFVFVSIIVKYFICFDYVVVDLLCSIVILLLMDDGWYNFILFI